MATSSKPHVTSRDESVSNYGSDVDDLSVVDSEYGSEFVLEEEVLIGELLTHLATTAPVTTALATDDESHYEVAHPGLMYELPASAPTIGTRVQKRATLFPDRGERSASVEIEYDQLSRETWTVPHAISVPSERNALGPAQSIERAENGMDSLSPLERFRTKPKKPLSVTDLVSPAWCELQYLYTLTKFGRKPRTIAMKQGSRVHRTLEEQVHEIVPVQTQSKEDRFGLKLWNTIQGLRTLRETGLTRELEVWGIVNGQVINGVIDELSYSCPDPDFEDQLKNSRPEKASNTLPVGPLSIEQSFADHKNGDNTDVWGHSSRRSRVVYLTDIKTRSVKSIPAAVSLRPTRMQLMIYHKMLEALSSNAVDAEKVFFRYNLDRLAPFTDVFTSEIASLGVQHDGTLDDASHAFDFAVSETRSHNNLSALWSFMISELSLTIDELGGVLRAEFRFAQTGEPIGSEVFAYDGEVVEGYISAEMDWWMGKREALGVEVEEAFKCRICDFAPECTWRKGKIDEATKTHRLRLAGRARSTS